MLSFLGISTVTEKPDTRMSNALAGAFGGAQMGLGIANAQNFSNYIKTL